MRIQNAKIKYLKVALPTPLRKLFDYLPPENHPNDQIAVGSRLRVPFGKQEMIGTIIAVTDKTDWDPKKLKAAYEILDSQPIFNPHLLELLLWTSRYYQGSLGEVFETAWPKKLREGQAVLKDFSNLDKTKDPCKILQREKPTLNTEQQQAILSLSTAFGSFKTFLLYGITGSGKTEVYLRLTEIVLERNQQVLILVPEIGLTPQMLERFQTRFPEQHIAVLHSGLTDKRRFEAWTLAQSGQAKIVIGTRSAVFVPLSNPGLFIIDEEHDASFKQQEGFRYSARDTLIMRAALEKCPVMLGSATPALETLNNVQQNRYCELKLKERAGKAELPKIEVIDIRHKKLEEGLSLEVIHAIRQHLTQHSQVMLFLNRRGYAPVLMCFDCGKVMECQHCDAKLTVHFSEKKLKCHHCEAILTLPEVCPECASVNLKPLGFGTERLEKILKKYFPEENILRLDRDTMRKKGRLEAAFTQIHNGEASIILGTQMIAKGHHFPNLNLVVILDTDHALFSNDFRSLERLGQLLTQVAGRSGRGNIAGSVLLQSLHPEHPLLNVLLKEGYETFAQILLEERKKTGLPPFCYQALIRAESKSKDTTIKFLDDFKKLIKSKLTDKGMDILGPVLAPMEKKGDRYRAQLLIQSKDRSKLQAMLNAALSEIETVPNRTLKWSIDVDPIDMY